MELPESVQEIADVIGRESALLLIDQLPTCDVRDKRSNSVSKRAMLYVPKKLKPHHRLIQILGEERAKRLVEGFGGETLHPANCNGLKRAKRDEEIRQQHAAGTTHAALAAAHGLSARQIGNIVRSAANAN